ncbi:hypothetical protein Poly30_16540 [Planctomycetes bacterium Poly30]|uniref:Uncharacterized protein n=1 Tax=Saltatorellus ferox TaxID=2528018 RepID=A0A518EPY8_9BACT|nr:hypothetical protein Poly30_16540 [Planctomycetes bacterium Poly30]
MRNSLPFVSLLCASSLFVLGSCGGGEAHDEHAGHDHAPGEHVDGAEQPNDHAAEMEERGAVDLGSIEIAGATLVLDAAASPTPGETVTINANVKSGKLPETLRMWYGLESAVGSMKAKADVHDDHLHVDVEIPAEAMQSPMLWLEAQAASGEKQIVSVAYPETTK